MAQLQLRPFTVGEILDATFTIYRRRFQQLTILAAIIVVPLGLIQGWLAAELSDASADPDDVGATILAASLALFVVGFLIGQLATAAITRAVADAYLELESDWRSSWNAATARFGTILVAAILYGIGLFFGLLFLVIPGIIIAVSWAVYMPAIMVEDLGASDSLRRSWNLVSGRRWPVFGTILLVTILAGIAGAIVSGILGALFPDSAAGQALVSMLGSLVTTPFVAAATVVIYFDLRVRKEGFDLELLASQLPDGSGVAPPAASDFNPPPEATEGEGDAWPPPVDG